MRVLGTERTSTPHMTQLMEDELEDQTARCKDFVALYGLERWCSHTTTQTKELGCETDSL